MPKHSRLRGGAAGPPRVPAVLPEGLVVLQPKRREAGANRDAGDLVANESQATFAPSRLRILSRVRGRIGEARCGSRRGRRPWRPGAADVGIAIDVPPETPPAQYAAWLMVSVLKPYTRS